MADIGELSERVEHSLSANRADSIIRALVYVDTQVTHMREELAALLDGSENKHGEELLVLLGRVATNLEEASNMLPKASQEKDALLADWTGNGNNAQPEETSNVIVIPPRTDTPVATGPMFDTKRNYFEFDTQARLDTNLTTIITPEAIGEDSANAILLELGRRGQSTVRDILSSGAIAVASDLSPEDLQNLHTVLARHCPGMPLRRMVTCAEIARFNTSVEHLPIQTVIPDYIHPQGRRVTIGQVYDMRLRTLKKTAPNYLTGNLPRYEEDIHAFLDSFNQTHRRLERHNRDTHTA